MLAFLCAVVVVEHHFWAVVAHGVLHDVAARKEAGEGDAAVGERPLQLGLVLQYQVVEVDQPEKVHSNVSSVTPALIQLANKIVKGVLFNS